MTGSFRSKLLSGSGVVGRGHVIKAATRVPSRALPRRRALCMNWKVGLTHRTGSIPIHANSRETYGSPRVHAELRAGGEKHGRKRVARLMRAAGLVGASRRRAGVTTTKRDREARPAPDLVDRDFTATAPNQLWVADITFVPTATGLLYLAVVLDAWSRKIVGWSMANHLRAELVLDAMEMAIGQRRPKDVIHHSDQGSQLGFNRSSQHQREPIAAPGQTLRRVFSSPGSCAARR